MTKTFIFFSMVTSPLKTSIMHLSTHKNLSFMWNFGSFLGFILTFQIITGLLLSFNFVSSDEVAFSMVISSSRDFLWSNLLRVFHSNGASLFFVFIFLHIFRGIFFSSFRFHYVWMSGVSMLLILMGIAFLGYVLPWGQMSLWGASVITNLLGVFPYIGSSMVIWLWGGMYVNTTTLGFFYSLHFILPFVLLMLVFIHILLLHESGSSSKLETHFFSAKMSFMNFYLSKDAMNLIVFISFIFFFLFFPFLLGDPENFISANLSVSPAHIQPEWYFLFAYAILRSIPNKFGGVVALLMSVVSLYFLVFFKKQKYMTKKNKSFSWFFFFCCVLLTWIGMSVVENPFIFIGQTMSGVYFFCLFFLLF